MENLRGSIHMKTQNINPTYHCACAVITFFYTFRRGIIYKEVTLRVHIAICNSYMCSYTCIYPEHKTFYSSCVYFHYQDFASWLTAPRVHVDSSSHHANTCIVTAQCCTLCRFMGKIPFSAASSTCMHPHHVRHKLDESARLWCRLNHQGRLIELVWKNSLRLLFL